MRYAEPERHRSHRRHDYGRGHGHVHDGQVRVRDYAYKFKSPRLMIDVPFLYSWASRHTLQAKCLMNLSRVLSLGTETRLNTLISSFQGVRAAKRPCV
jgi:hypothetical protein